MSFKFKFKSFALNTVIIENYKSLIALFKLKAFGDRVSHMPYKENRT